VVEKAHALVLESPRRLTKHSFDIPKSSEADAVVKVDACGLCGTDHEQYTGAFPASFAFIPGHETVGTVIDIGPKAKEKWGVKEGDRIALEVFQSCGNCQACLAGNYRNCEKHGVMDMYGYISIDKPPSLWGGYATHQYLSADSIVHQVPADLDPVIATLFNPLGAGFRWAVSVPNLKKDEIVAILGPGIRGLACLIAAKEAGASFVIVTGFGDKDLDRLRTAKNFGADLAIDVSKEDPVKILRNATSGHMADVVVDVTAKAPSALAQAIELAGFGGRVVLAGTKLSSDTPGFWPDAIIYKELTVLGALGVDSPAYAKAIETLSKGRYPFESLSRQVVNLDTAEQLIIQMAGESNAVPPQHGVIVP
jgi:alcohol dehydrogenase